MPDETSPPPPAEPATPAATAEGPPLSPPLEVLPPPAPSRIAGFFRFSGGCLIVLVVAGAVASAAFGDLRHLLGCAALQLVYLVPAVAFLLRRQKPAWAYGMITGGAIVFLLASLCSGPLDFK